MSRTQKKTLQLSPLEKEALDLRKLRKAKSFLKSNDTLDKWFDSQIRKRETQIYQEKRKKRKDM